MELKRIATETPHTEIWRMLAQFAYPANIEKYFQHSSLTGVQTTFEYVSGCLKQADAYFKAASNAPLDISPLLIYYGATNLLAGASVLLSGKESSIQNHGMKLNANNDGRIADVEITPIDPSHGALSQFCNIFSPSCSITNGAKWSAEELFASIPDLKNDFENCYPEAIPFVIPIEQYEVEGTLIERISLSELERFDNPVENIKNSIPEFKKTYLEPQVNRDVVILNPKLNSTDIGIYSIFGSKYLQFNHVKNEQSLLPDQIIIMFMAMYSLGYLSRYRPEKWNSFVQSDKTGEKLLIERFMDICHRFFPNLVLNKILNLRIQFVNETAATRIVDSYNSATARRP